MFDLDEEDPVKRIQGFLDMYNSSDDYKGPDALLMRTIKPVSAVIRPNPSGRGELASAVFELPVLSEFCNPTGVMHGGLCCTIIDMATSMAIIPIAKEDFWLHFGVTRTINMTCIVAVKPNSTVLIEANVVGIGKRLSTIVCQIRDKATGAVLVTGEHGKAAIDTSDREERKSNL